MGMRRISIYIYMVILGGYYRIINADLFSNGTSSIDAQTRPMLN